MPTRVIVIDDDVDTVEVYVEYLTMKGIEVVGFGYNGKDAVSLYQKFKPDIVLVDLMMPDYDGLYAIENIRKFDQSSKILVATADKTDKSRSTLESYNVNGIVYKPYDVYSILDSINKIIQGKRVYP